MQRSARVQPFGVGLPAPVLSRPGNGFVGQDRLSNHNAKAFGFDDWGLSRLSYELGGAKSLTKPFEESFIVYAAMHVKTTNAKQAPLVFWDSDSDDAAPVSTSDPLYARLREPNPIMSWATLLEATIVHLDLTGECFWFLFQTDASGGEVAEGADAPGMVWPVAGSSVEPWTVSEKRVGWKFRANSRTYEFHNHAVLHFRYFDPANPERGLGPIEALARVLGLQFNAEKYLDGLLRNNGSPSGIIYAKHALTQDQVEQAQASTDSTVNAPEHAGKWKVVGGTETEFKELGFNPKDMEHNETFSFVRRAVCSVEGVPEILLGYYEESATYHNMLEAKRSLWTETLIPLLDYIAETITRFMLAPRGLQWIADFDTSGVEALKKDITDQLLKAGQIVALGIGLSLNEVVGMVGLEIEPPENGDVHFVSPTLLAQDGTLGDERRAREEAQAAAAAEAQERMEAARASPNNVTNQPSKGLSSVSVLRKSPGRDRREYWKSFSARVLFPSQKQIELAARRFLAKYASAQRSRVRDFAEHGHEAKGFTKDIALDLDALLLDKAEWAAKFETIIRPALTKAWALALADAADDVGDFQLGPSDERIRRAIDQQLIKLTEGVNGTLAEKVRTALAETMAEASTIGDLQAAVREALPAMEESLSQVFGTNESRALAIARTESAHAANTARVEQYQEAGIEKIEWIHAGPVTEDAREDHVALDGQRVKLGATFSNGLSFPHDPNAPADEVVNCACISAAVIE